MRNAAAIALLVSLLPASAADAQKNSEQTAKPPELTGCVSGQPAPGGVYTLTDAQGGKYKLTGKKMQKYAGRMVVVGGSNKRVSVNGGLWPSPNAAGQAGALDPAQESIARQRGGATRPAGQGADQLPEFNVVHVRTLEGACQ
jgi:hypothetical protein